MRNVTFLIWSFTEICSSQGLAPGQHGNRVSSKVAIAPVNIAPLHHMNLHPLMPVSYPMYEKEWPIQVIKRLCKPGPNGCLVATVL